MAEIGDCLVLCHQGSPRPEVTTTMLHFFFLVVFISTCLVTVTPQCILFSEVVKRIVK